MLSDGAKFGRYTIVRLLGKGGMGKVYLVRHDVLDAYFALKVLSPDMAARNAQFIPRFLREAKLCCRLRHPNLVSVHDAGRDEATGLYYLVMDYAPGGNLRDMIEEAHGAIPADRALRIMRELTAALVSASDFGLVHRDIKPENIMFGPKGEAKLADMGIAKASDDNTLLTMDNAVFGTPAYMSPEQACDSGKVDARADIYSLGIVFFEMLSGRRPYGGASSVNVIARALSDEPIPDVREFAPEVSEPLAQVVRDMCEKNVDKRIQSALALLDRLDAIAGTKTSVIRLGLKPRMRTVRLLSLLLAASVLAALVGFGWFAISQSQRAPSPVSPSQTSQKPMSEPSQKLTSAPSAPKAARPADKAPSEWRPPRPTTVFAHKETPAPAISPTKVPTQAPTQETLPDQILPGTVVVLGSEKDDAAALKARLGAAAFREAANSARLEDQIDSLCLSKPKKVYLKLAAAAAEGGMSENGFDNMIRKAANRLHDRGVPFEFVLEPDTAKTQPYNRMIREVCNSLSYSIVE